MADIDMDAVLAKRAEAAGLDDPTLATFTFMQQVWEFPHPLFAVDEWKDGLSELQERGRKGEANDPDLARYYLGEDQYERFLTAGGNSGIVLFAVAQVMQRATDEANEAGAYTVLDVLGQAPEAIEADLEQTYGYDVLAAYWRHEITLRGLRVRVEHLPPGGPYYRALHDGSYWTDREHLLAEIVDVTAAYGAGAIRAAGGKVRRPRPIRRPGQKTTRRMGDTTGQDPAQVISYLASIAPRPRAARTPTGA